MAVTKQQVRVHMLKRELGHTQITAAAKADFSERTGRRIEQGETSPSLPKPCHWRTRADPFEGVWEPELRVLLEANPGLQAITLLEALQDRYPGCYPDKLLRTLQRRVEDRGAGDRHEEEVVVVPLPPPAVLVVSGFSP